MTRATRRGLAVVALVAFAELGCGGGDTTPAVATPGPGSCKKHAFTEHGGTRVFAIQPHVTPESFASYDAFHAHLRKLVDAEVTPCLAKDRPNVIVFPEDVGLPAGFIGSRAKDARTKATAVAGFLALSKPYAPAIAYYTSKLGKLGLAQGLLLGVTDTLWRAFYETMIDVASATGATVIGSTNVSGTIVRSTDPAELAALRDPDLPGTPYVYVAKDAAIYNTAFVIAPNGDIVARRRKPYLVELEEGTLSLSYGALAEIAPVPVGTLRAGVLTSKDAWMPDVVGRLASLGADVFVQPEAFSGWAIQEQPGDWLPDVFLESAWAATQKHGGFRFGVVPHLTGNLLDLVFDGQAAILTDAVPGATRAAYMGEDALGGFADVAPWAIEDPGVADPKLGQDARRAALRAEGEALLPGGAKANQYVEAVVAGDLDPAAPFSSEPAGPPGALGASRAAADAPAGEQARPALASDGASAVYLVWQDDRDGRAQVYVASSSDEGVSFGAAHAVAASPSDELDPAVLVRGGSVYVAWAERSQAGQRVVVAVSSDAGVTFGAPVQVSGAGAELDEWRPALATDGAATYVAYVASLAGNERIAVARTTDGKAYAVASADATAPPKPAPNTRNNQWAPAIAAKPGEIDVAWVDFRAYQWDVYLARSTDGGVSFGAAARVDDGTDMPERLNDDPALAFAPGGALLAGWTDVRLRKAPSKARIARASGAAFAASQALGAAPASASAWRPRLASAGPKVVAVWQDFRTLGNDVYLATSADGGATWGAERRVDDGGEGPSYQLAPAVAATGARVVVAWEDTRSGRRRIRWASGAP